MLSTLLLIYLVHSGSADAGIETEGIMPRCSNSPVNMTFTPVEGYVGRYTAELCTRNLTHRNLSRVEWELHVWFYETRDYCNSSLSSSNKLLIGRTHSINVEWVNIKHNCTGNQTVCMSVQFDLIFSACYSIGTRFKEISARPQYYYFDIMNPYTELHFHNNHATVDLMYDEDYMSVTWHTGIPPSVYSVMLYNVTDQASSGELVTNCSITDKTTIKCYLSPDYGCYTICLKHIVSWIVGIFYKQESVPIEICRNKTTPVVEVSDDAARAAAGAWAWGSAAAGAALALLALLACAARRTRAAGRRQLKVLGSWLKHGAAHSSAETAAALQPARRHVLLLAAREGAAAARARAALAACLRHVVDGQVYDIFAPEVMALCAGAPAEWVRSMLLRSDVAVVLVQSPALECLYSARTSDTASAVRLVSPLLGRRVVPRLPRFGDALLQYALRLVSERGAAAHDYCKYYLATISELPTEVFPCIVPYRRYSLPAAAPLLLRDISSPLREPPPPEAIETFTQLLKEFVDYVRENPEYLMEELMVIDS